MYFDFQGHPDSKGHEPRMGGVGVARDCFFSERVDGLESIQMVIE